MFAADIADPGTARVLVAVAVVLALLGVLLAAVTVWFWQRTKPLHPALRRLDVMGSKRWHQAADEERRAALERARPASAVDDEPGSVKEAETEESVDG